MLFGSPGGAQFRYFQIKIAQPPAQPPPDVVFKDKGNKREDVIKFEQGNLTPVRSDSMARAVERCATDLIRAWTADMVNDGMQPGTWIQSQHRGQQCRLDLQGYFYRNIRYANFQIQTGRRSVAAAFVEVGVNFGKRRIRRALNESLNKTYNVFLFRRYLRNRNQFRRVE